MDYTTLLPQLTLEEKVSLLSGETFRTTPGVPRLGIPRSKLVDGVNGARPAQFDGGMTTTCFPNTTCLASTWDKELLREMGETAASQAWQKSAQVLLGPTIGMYRDPRGGRNFECFGEDPLLTGQLCAAIVNGIQSKGVGACPKHLVCNESEYLRHYYSVKESTTNSRALREIYLAAWQHMLRACDPVAVMSAYNKVDGVYCSENEPLVEKVLRGTWGFKGLVMSDWFAVRSTVASIKAGTDLEMPFPVWRGPRLITAVRTGELEEESDINPRVMKMLELRNKTRRAQRDEPETSVIDPETNKVLRRLAADGIVLLRNDNASLPLRLSQPGRIAVIGEFAKSPVVSGGGSASCNPQYRTAPFDALREMVPGHIEMHYAPGVRTRRILPEVNSQLLEAQDGRQGVNVTYYNDGSPEPLLSEFSEKPAVWMLGRFVPGLKVPGSRLEMTTTLQSPSTGRHTLGVRCTGAFSLLVDDVEVLAGPQPDVSTEQFLFNHIKLESRVRVSLAADQRCAIRLVVKSRDRLHGGEPTPFSAALCFEEEYSEEAAIAQASEIAKQADTSIIFAGRDAQRESEGYDLEDMSMPLNQTALIRAVAAVSKKTVLVLHCGNAIDVSPFIDEVDAVLSAHFPGQEGPNAIADILTGRVNPSGRLTFTWFKALEDAPSFGDFPAAQPPGGHGDPEISYAEGVKVGYRHPEPQRARFPFGHGLSYTTFSYTELMVTVAEDPKSLVRSSVRVTNSGTCAGREVVQLYVSPASPGIQGIFRPARELKAFAKTRLLQPGESQVVDLEVELRVACSYWDEGLSMWRMEPGRYGVHVGGGEGEFDVSAGETWDHL